MRKRYFELNILEKVYGYLERRTYHFYNKTDLENELKDTIKNYKKENGYEPVRITIFFFDETEIFGQLIKQNVKKVFEWNE